MSWDDKEFEITLLPCGQGRSFLAVVYLSTCQDGISLAEAAHARGGRPPQACGLRVSLRRQAP